MAPTPSVSTRVYTVTAATLLALWTLTALGFTALSIGSANRSLIEPAASISLLTYLVCRLIVFLQPGWQPDSLAHVVALAHRQSRQGALAMLVCACAWLYELASQAVMLFFVTFFGGILATAVYNDAFEETTANQDDLGADTTALAEIDAVKAKAGVDPTQLFKMIPPKLLVYFAALVWANFATLGVYVLRLAWRSVRVVLGSPVGRAGKSEAESERGAVSERKA
ncbi:uncharacterized protein N7459_004095 [Penicillium hispanicum]|uniref:uncharacterized protein n=1 Tax=Penicillium hispanicum TaxID=1080232 RepID=UPI0025400414|nr:uncharacterized protein N7459_004095 [Penicillium hispanicum]KAJ5584295.1 hypothetical protein N7459_004095 [Penicillium hispanicum]